MAGFPPERYPGGLEGCSNLVLSDEELSRVHPEHDPPCKRYAESFALGIDCVCGHAVCDRCANGHRGQCEFVSAPSASFGSRTSTDSCTGQPALHPDNQRHLPLAHRLPS